MPAFDDSTRTSAAPEEVWKLLYDPARFPQWWAGVGSVEPGEGGYTMYPDGYPDFPMPQALATDTAGGCVSISCLVSDLSFVWRLRSDSGGTEISVHVEIPDAEADRLDAQREVIRRSLENLAELAGRP
jgi:Polyketide cyclase / dehydrase and lipid transport